MDLKGYQYQGGLQGGPTCVIASMHPMIGDNIMKIESLGVASQKMYCAINSVKKQDIK